jgi:regulator of sigma E protease
MVILNWIYVVAAVIVLFGAAIFVHEFGHFWMARRRGLVVEEFSIGLGPKIFGWRRNGVDYSLRWIPAGGYVKLPQMVTSEAMEGKSESTDPLPPISPFSKILVAFLGPFMNVVFAFLLACIIYFAGLPILINPSIIGDVDPDSPEAHAGVCKGDRIVSVNGKLVKSWSDVQTIVSLAPTNVFIVTLERQGLQTNAILQSVPNKFVGKILNLYSAPQFISQVTAGGAAELAGLKVNDQVVSFAGVPVVGQQQLINLIRRRPEMETEIQILRSNQPIKLSVTPRLEPAKKIGLIGVGISSGKDEVSVYEVQKPGPLPWELMGEVWDQIASTIRALAHSKQSGIGVDKLSGPVGILMMLSSQVNADYRLALKFMVMLNISLAVLNLLPIPVLDGGHILMALYEKVFRRPVNPRFQELVTNAFAILIIGFFLYVTFNDVFKNSDIYKAMIGQKTQIVESNAGTGVPVTATNLSK